MHARSLALVCQRGEEADGHSFVVGESAIGFRFRARKRGE
jgi:hypothetical protein